MPKYRWLAEIVYSYSRPETLSRIIVLINTLPKSLSICRQSPMPRHPGWHFIPDVLSPWRQLWELYFSSTALHSQYQHSFRVCNVEQQCHVCLYLTWYQNKMLLWIIEYLTWYQNKIMNLGIEWRLILLISLRLMYHIHMDVMKKRSLHKFIFSQLDIFSTGGWMLCKNSRN